MNERITQIEMEEKMEFSAILRNRPNLDSGAYNALHQKSGDFRLPNLVKNELDTALKEENLFRSYGTVVNTSQSGNSIHTTLSVGEADVVGDGDLYPVDEDEFTSTVTRTCKIAALTKLRDEFVYDNKFNVDKYLNKEFAQRFGRAEERYFINGTGINQPLGVLSKEADVVTSDDGELKYADIVNLYFSVKDKYAKNGVFVVNRKTAMALRKMLDDNGMPIWNINDNTMFSKPVLICEFMPDIESGNKSVFFGDLSYYWILITQPLRFRVLTEVFASEGAIGYAAHERLDGRLVNNEAVSVLQVK